MIQVLTGKAKAASELGVSGSIKLRRQDEDNQAPEELTSLYLTAESSRSALGAKQQRHHEVKYVLRRCREYYVRNSNDGTQRRWKPRSKERL